MTEESFQERTEQATGKRRGDARNKGQVARSMDMNSAFMLMFGLLLLLFTGAAMVTGLADMIREFFARASRFHADMEGLRQLIIDVMLRLLVILGPVVGGLAVVGLASGYAQVGPLWTFEPMKPSFGKMNPLNGIKKIIISRRTLVELAKNVLKASVVGIIAYVALEGIMSETVTLMDGDASTILSFMARAALGLGFKTGLAFLALAVLDYIYQRFEHERNLKMTKEAVKEENKELEGDPIMKGRIRGIQRRLAYRRMMHDVPKADVVVTNPTHLAVALKYESSTMSAPRVVAKGAGLIAERIKTIAREHHVPIIEDKPLARTLFKSVEVGDEVPEKLFQAVAQVLAYIYRLRTLSPSAAMN